MTSHISTRPDTPLDHDVTPANADTPPDVISVSVASRRDDTPLAKDAANDVHPTERPAMDYQMGFASGR